MDNTLILRPDDFQNIGSGYHMNVWDMIEEKIHNEFPHITKDKEIEEIEVQIVRVHHTI